MTAADAMSMIRKIMEDTEDWNADTLEMIAGVVLDYYEEESS